MPYRCSKKFRFSAAHALTQLPKEHKCHNLHGHNYEVTITLGPRPRTLNIYGMVLDFGLISQWWEREVKPLLDHQNLNEVPELVGIHLTAECLAKWIFDKCWEWTTWTYSVRVQETPTCYAEYIRDD